MKRKLPATQVLSEAVEKLIHILVTYDSDTFCAGEARLDRSEAKRIAARLIDRIEDHLDGVTITAYLDELREDSAVTSSET